MDYYDVLIERYNSLQDPLVCMDDNDWPYDDEDVIASGTCT